MKMRLYHVGDRAIPEPDVHYGRRNADFGQGFYLTPEPEFARRWAGEKAVLNEYELELGGLTVSTCSGTKPGSTAFSAAAGDRTVCAPTSSSARSPTTRSLTRWASSAAAF